MRVLTICGKFKTRENPGQKKKKKNVKLTGADGRVLSTIIIYYYSRFRPNGVFFFLSFFLARPRVQQRARV